MSHDDRMARVIEENRALHAKIEALIVERDMRTLEAEGERKRAGAARALLREVRLLSVDAGDGLEVSAEVPSGWERRRRDASDSPA